MALLAGHVLAGQLRRLPSTAAWARVRVDGTIPPQGHVVALKNHLKGEMFPKTRGELAFCEK